MSGRPPRDGGGGGRGRGRGRGRGDNSSRGRGGDSGRGRGGDSGRGQGGDSGRGQGGDSGRGRGGDFSRGRGNESSRGYGSDSSRGRGGDHGRGRGRGDGRGSFKGGQGRGGGNTTGATTNHVFGWGSEIPKPDDEVTKCEDRIVRQQSQTGQKSNDILPLRPAFGTRGDPVVLWTNYFEVKAKTSDLYSYGLTLQHVTSRATTVASSSPATDSPHQQPRPGPATAGTAAATADASAPGPRPPRPSTQEAREVKGGKLHASITELLRTLLAQNKRLALATEYKSKLISATKLAIKDKRIQLQVPVDVGSERFDNIDVLLHGPTDVNVGSLINYLSVMNDEASSGLFPQYPAVVDALNIILGHGPRSRLDAISTVGLSRFFPFGRNEKALELFGDGRALIAARGFFQSTRLATNRLLLNVNATHGIFKPSGRLSTLMDEFGIRAVKRTDTAGQANVKLFAKFLPKTRVWCDLKLADGTVVRRSKAIHAIVSKSGQRRAGTTSNENRPPEIDPDYEFPGPRNVRFWLNDELNGSRYITVHDYWTNKYNITLANYPLVNLGRADKPVLVPAEAVEIKPGQSLKAKLTMAETTAMLGFACCSPYANALTISKHSRPVLELDDDNSLSRFGLSVDKKLLTVNGRILGSPTVSYISKQQKQLYVTPQNGSWNLKGVNVVESRTKIDRWIYVNVLNGRGNRSIVEPDSMAEFVNFLADSMGIKFNKRPMAQGISITNPSNFGSELESIFQWASKEKVQLIFFVLSDRGSQDLYSAIKAAGDCDYGIHTNCLLAKHLSKKGNAAYYANIGLKINLKFGGVNHTLHNKLPLISEGKTMIVGYDVSHPTNMSSAAEPEAPSVAGLVASIDSKLNQWPASSWKQSSRQEMLSENLTEAIQTHLKLWKDNNKEQQLPKNLLIFRDGVSEGQFSQVLSQELPLIRKAFKGLYKAKEMPLITIVVSVKRHQTRFYPTSMEKKSRSGNVLNGTVVDRGVTQARYWDFFLTAHDALQGTARPAHYTVLHDEIFRNKFQAAAADELQRVTHELCYLYGRASKAVSICPPAYYADVVCFRSRIHNPEAFEGSDSQSVASGSQPQQAVSFRKVHKNLENSMYYI